jgi:hypothetical protein
VCLIGLLLKAAAKDHLVFSQTYSVGYCLSSEKLREKMLHSYGCSFNSNC